MKKTLLMLFVASSIIAPVNQCIAAPMSRLAKSFVMVGLAGIGVASYKISQWYKQQEAISNFNILYVTSWKNIAVYAQWKFNEFPTIESLLKSKKDVIEALRQEDKQLAQVKEDIIQELARPTVSKMVSVLLPYTACATTEKDFYFKCSDDELKEYCARIELDSVNGTEVVLGPCEYSAAYACNVLRYVGNKTKRFVTWVTRKPSLDQKTRKRFVEVLQKYRRLQVLLAVVNEAIKQEDAEQFEKKAKEYAAQRAAEDQVRDQLQPARGSCSAAPLAEPPVQQSEEVKNNN